MVITNNIDKFYFVYACRPVNMFSFQDGSVTWNVDDDTKLITFTLKVKATGWLGLGITKENKEMKNMDIAIGGVGTGNHGYIGVCDCNLVLFMGT